MSNIVHLSSSHGPVEIPVPLMDVLAQKLNVSPERPQITALGLPHDFIQSARQLPVIAMDPMCQTDDQIHFAYTFEGAAALGARIIVHNRADLAAFGGAIFDGHILLVSFDELKTQFNKHYYDARQWLREGCGACAAHALGLEREKSEWTYVDPEQLRPIMSAPEMDFVFWKPDRAQDAYRYTSALEKLSGGLAGKYPPHSATPLDSGSANVHWNSVLKAWDEFHASKEWNILRTQKAGNPEIGRLLGQTLTSLTSPCLQERFVHLLVRGFSQPLSVQDKVQIIKSAKASHNDITKGDIESMVNALSGLSSPVEVIQKNEIEHAWHKVLSKSWVTRYEQSQDQGDLMVAAAIQMSGKEDKDGKAILSRLMDDHFQSHSYTTEQLNALSQYAPRAFYNPHVLSSPDDGATVYNMLKQMKCLVLTPREHSFQLQAHEFIPMIAQCVKNGWGGYNMDIRNEANQINWGKLVTLTTIHNDNTHQLPELFAAANSHNPDFASDLCACLMNANYEKSEVTQMLIDSGVNWEQQWGGKSLAQLVFANPHMPLSIKTQARRALQETGLDDNIVPFAKKK